MRRQVTGLHRTNKTAHLQGHRAARFQLGNSDSERSRLIGNREIMDKDQLLFRQRSKDGVSGNYARRGGPDG